MGDRFDVVVVGARVAGASTAMLLARCGHRVLLVDRAAMPSDTVSTHAILRTGVLQLRRWGLLEEVLAAGTPPVRNVTLGFGDERIAFAVAEEHGVDAFLAPRRHILDGILVEAARREGVEFRPRIRLVGVRRDPTGRVCGVELGAGRSRTTVAASMVIGADGVDSRMAALVGAGDRYRHPATNAVHYAYYSGIDADGFWFNFAPGVNAGLIPTNDGATLVFAGRPTGLFPRFSADPEGEFLRLVSRTGDDLAARVREGTRVSGFRGTRGLEGHLRRAWGPGWALVGDAGYTKDPISAHGISDAFRDAELCARAVDATLRDPGAERRAMDRFEARRDALSLPMLHQSQALADYRWSPEEASARMRRVSELVRDECAMLLTLSSWAGVPEPVSV